MLVSCLVSLHPSPCLHLLVIQRPSSCAWVPNASCFCASAKDQQLGSNLRTRAGRGSWVSAQERQAKCEPCGCWGRGAKVRGNSGLQPHFTYTPWLFKPMRTRSGGSAAGLPFPLCPHHGPCPPLPGFGSDAPTLSQSPWQEAAGEGRVPTRFM